MKQMIPMVDDGWSLVRIRRRTKMHSQLLYYLIRSFVVPIRLIYVHGALQCAVSIVHCSTGYHKVVISFTPIIGH